MIANRTPLDTWHADVLVLGAGVAGLCAALTAAPRRVLLLCPDEPAYASSSACAQGGIAAPIGPDDSVESHIVDTLNAACHSADQKVVSRIIEHATAAVEFLEASGVKFDRDGSCRSLHLEAGHRHARVAHAAGDRSGEVIVAALWARVRTAPHVELVIGWRAVELLTTFNNRVNGALIVDIHGGVAVVHADEIVLATGGIGRLYRYTTNGEHATGDGLAMALAIGARTAALEFVQFHPTALRVAADPLPLLTEALRGAGGHLITSGGVAVMAGRHALGDLAPRDVVARAVWELSMAGKEVLLDATGVFRSAKGDEFPGARHAARLHGIDPVITPLPVTAAAHYHMGGVIVDTAGRTSIAGLWACGEVAFTGLHGANRLASNSLLEAVVCGQAAGTALAGGHSQLRKFSETIHVDLPTVTSMDGGWQHLRDRMWHALGPVRDAATLRLALAATLNEREVLAPEYKVLRNRFGLVAAMLAAALVREESRGAHWRTDFPRRDQHRDGPQAVYPYRMESAFAATDISC